MKLSDQRFALPIVASLLVAISWGRLLFLRPFISLQQVSHPLGNDAFMDTGGIALSLYTLLPFIALAISLVYLFTTYSSPIYALFGHGVSAATAAISTYGIWMMHNSYLDLVTPLTMSWLEPAIVTALCVGLTIRDGVQWKAHRREASPLLDDTGIRFAIVIATVQAFAFAYILLVSDSPQWITGVELLVFAALLLTAVASYIFAQHKYFSLAVVTSLLPLTYFALASLASQALLGPVLTVVVLPIILWKATAQSKQHAPAYAS